MSKNPKNALAAMAQRLTALNGLGVDARATAGLDALLATAAKAPADAVPMMQYEGKETPLADVMTSARKGVAGALHALNALRMENVDTYVRATLDLSLMFEPIRLGKEEQPVIENSYRNPVNVRYSGEDGGMRGAKAVKARAQTFFNMREIHSDTVGYQVRDINQGTDIGAASMATVDIAWDVAHKINTEMFNLLQGGTINGQAYGLGIYRAFDFSNANKLKRTLVLHPGIQSANLPTTNLITYATLNSVYGHATNLFDFTVLRAIIDYVEGFRGVFADGDLEATGAIYLPSSEVSGLLAAISPTGAFYNKVGESVLNSFTKVEYGGRVWTLIGTPFLPKGACYPVLNKKVGNFYTKPEFDFEDVNTNILKNWEERTAVKVMALATLEPWRVNGLKVVYSNAGGAGTVTTNA